MYTVQPALYVVDISLYQKYMCVVSECLCLLHSVFGKNHTCVL